MRVIVDFSPLLIGVSDVTKKLGSDRCKAQDFSPLLIGVSDVTRAGRLQHKGAGTFQSPTDRGIRCNATGLPAPGTERVYFSPLLIGVSDVTRGTNSMEGSAKISVPY